MSASGGNGYRRASPRLPTGFVVASVLVALIAVSGLIFLLYEETRGPGEILRRFAREVDAGDCPGSYELLDESIRVDVNQGAWCEVLSDVDALMDADFDLEQAVLQGNEAEVHVSGVQAEVWRLRRFGERSWRVLGPEGGFP